jgi:CBS domain containing-hemolysin-like protein
MLGGRGSHSHTQVHSAEELEIQVQQARERGLLSQSEEKFILSAIQLSQLRVREIIVPRPDMHVLPVDADLDEALRVFVTTQRSRIPVYEGSVDHLLGFVHIKDMLWVLLDRQRRAEEGVPPPAFDLRRLLRELRIIPESKPAAELLAELRAHRAGMAAVVDEFGSILGLVTLEDLIEQVVGEIHDEFDVVERPQEVGRGPDPASTISRSPKIPPTPPSAVLCSASSNSFRAAAKLLNSAAIVSPSSKWIAAA